jgi:hypothetical protein
MTDPRPAENPESLLTIDAPHFYCGVLRNNDRVIRAAPIVRYLLGWNADRLKRYCAKRGWRIETATPHGGTP